MTSDRREFLKLLGKGTAGLFVAFSFGCSMRREAAGKKVAVVYASRYGATADTAQWIAKGIGGNATLVDLENAEVEQLIGQYDLLVLGSGVWVGGVHARFKKLTNQYGEGLQEKLLATFVVCGTEDHTEDGQKRIAGYLAQFDASPKYEAYFGGRLVVERLTEEDRQTLTQFYKVYLKKELASWDRTDAGKAQSFGRAISVGT